MAMDVDRLEIRIEAEASKASAALDTLYNKLGNVSSAMGVSTSKYRSMARQINNLAAAVQNFGNISGNAGKGVNTINVQVNQMRTNATKTSKSFSDLANSAKKMASSLAGVGSAGKTAFSTMYNLIPNVVSQMKRLVGLSTGIDRTSNSFSGLLRSILPFISAYKLFGWAKESTELASSLTEVQNVVDHAFGSDGAAKVDKFAETSIKKYGIAALSAKQAASRFQSMGVTMGITADQVKEANQRVSGSFVGDYKDAGDTLADMSINLTKLTADLASFYDKDFSTVAEAMNSVYTGTTRPLRAYGIDLTQATLQEWANKQGIDAKVASMTQAQKAMLRYQYIISNTSMVMGDSARTADTWANTMRRLKQNFQALGATIGGVIVNAFGPLLRWMNNFIQNVNAFAETVANALGKIFGWTIKTSPGSLADTDYGDLASDLDDAAGGAGDLADDADDAAGGLGKAAKNAKELQRTILSFDEINKLNDTTTNEPGSGGNGGGSGSPSGGGAGAGGLGGNGAAAGSAVLVQTDSLLKKFESEIDTLFKLGQYIGTKLKDALNSIKWEEDVYPAADEFGTGLAEFLNGLFDDPTVFESVGNAVAGALNTVLHVLDSFGSTFNWEKFGKSLGAGLAKFFKTWDANLSADVFKKFVNGTAKAIRSALVMFPAKTVGDKISGSIKSALSGIDWEEAVFPAVSMFGTKLAYFLNGLFDPETFKVIGSTVANRINASLQFLNSFGSTFDWSDFGDSIASAISGFFETWDPELTAETFNTFALGLLTSIKSAIEGVSWEQVGAKIAQLLKDINWKTLLQTAGDAIMLGINAALTTAESLFDGTPVEEAITKLKEAINGIAEMIDFPTIADGFKSIADACVSFGSGFASGLVEAFGSLAKIGTATLGAIGNVFKKIADALNSLPEGTLEKFGEGLGKVAGALIIIKGANSAAGVIGKIVSGLTGAGIAGTAAATGTTAAAGGLGGLAAKFGFLTTPLSHVLGGIGAFIAASEATKTVIDDDTEKINGISDAYLNLSTPLKEVADAAGMSNEAFINAMEPMEGISSTDGPALVQALTEVGDRFKEAGGNEYLFEQTLYDLAEQGKLSEESLGLVRDSIKNVDEATKPTKTSVANLIKAFSPLKTTTLEQVKAFSSQARVSYDDVRDALDKLAGKYEVVEELLPVLSDQLNSQEAMGSSAERGYLLVRNALEEMTGKTGEAAKALDEELSAAFLGSGDDAENADGKIGTMKTNLWKFAVGVGAKSILLAVVSTIFKGFATDAEDADTSIGTMQSNGSTALSTLGTDAENAGVSFKEGLVGTIESGKESIATSMTEIGESIRAPFANIGEEGYNTGFSFTDQISSGMKAGLVVPTITPTWTKYTYGKGGWFNIPDFSVSWNTPTLFANGGFPNLGDLFMANEKGPELVGKMGRRNAVANNMQITEGIREAVVDGMMEVAMTTSGDGSNEVPYVINMRVVTDDDETLARRVERGRMKRDARYSPSPAYA